MKITIAVTKTDEHWVARCLDFMTTETAKTRQDAIDHLIHTTKLLNKEHELRVLEVEKESYADWELIEQEIELD